MDRQKGSNRWAGHGQGLKQTYTFIVANNHAPILEATELSGGSPLPAKLTQEHLPEQNLYRLTHTSGENLTLTIIDKELNLPIRFTTDIQPAPIAEPFILGNILSNGIELTLNNREFEVRDTQQTLNVFDSEGHTTTVEITWIKPEIAEPEPEPESEPESEQEPTTQPESESEPESEQ